MPYHGAYIKSDNGVFVIWRAEIISDRPETTIGKITKKHDKLYLSFDDGTLLITRYEFREDTS
jgi:methionyl-tRNA formyltransferase